VIAALALDHRGSLVALMKAAAGCEPVALQVEEFKSVMTRRLSPMSSGVLLDQNYGRTAIQIRSKKTGLLLPYENDAYLNTHPEKLPTLISGASVRSLKEAGADCVKALMHYTPLASAEVEEFIESLEFAVESQGPFSGVLCGRAAWQDGVHAYARGGAKALEEWLDRDGEQNFARVIEMLKTAKSCIQ
jgi:tagatose-1,6-bisphosphate aldolase